MGNKQSRVSQPEKWSASNLHHQPQELLTKEMDQQKSHEAPMSLLSRRTTIPRSHVDLTVGQHDSKVMHPHPPSGQQVSPKVNMYDQETMSAMGKLMEARAHVDDEHDANDAALYDQARMVRLSQESSHAF